MSCSGKLRGNFREGKRRTSNRSGGYVDCGDEPVRGWRQNKEFFIGLTAATISPFGGLLAAPQITSLLRSWRMRGADQGGWTGLLNHGASNGVLWWVLITGLSLMVFGLVVLPLIIWKARQDRIESGVTARFTQRVDECVRAIIRFDKSIRTDLGNNDVSEGAKELLLEKITSEATYIIGNKARVCIYWRGAEESEGEEEKIAKYVLEWENVGDRSPRSQARPVIDASQGRDHQSFIDVIEEHGQRVVIQDVNKKRQNNFEVVPNRANGYNSFILVPIRASRMHDGRRATVGCMTIDFPGRNIITEEVELVASAIAEMCSEALEVAQDRVFTSIIQSHPVESDINKLLAEVDEDRSGNGFD